MFGINSSWAAAEFNLAAQLGMSGAMDEKSIRFPNSD